MRIRKNGKVIRLTESDLRRITKKVLREQTDSDWKNLADELEKAMKGLGTDTGTIQKIISKEVKDKSSWEKLNNAFGKREGEDLMGWLEGDLSTYDFNPNEDKLFNSIKKHIKVVSDDSKRINDSPFYYGAYSGGK